jgi:hypothetical protein
LNNIRHPESIFFENRIYNNSVLIGNGGALFLEDSQLQLKNNSIYNNTAQIGGGLRYIGQKSQILFDKSNTIHNNVAYMFGNNICSYPSTISIKYNEKVVEYHSFVLRAKSGIQIDNPFII